MDANDKIDQIPQGVPSTDKVDKLQKELDDLERRAKEELSKQKPHFSVVSEEPETPKEILATEPTEELPQEPPKHMEPEFKVENEPPKEEGKILSENVVEDEVLKKEPNNSQKDVVITQPMQVQTTTSTEKVKPPMDSNKMTKTIFWIALMLFIITLTAVGAYFVGSMGTPTQTQATQTPLAVKTPIATQTPTPTPSTQVFKNDTYGYSVEYPEDAEMFNDLNTPDEIVAIISNGNSISIYADSKKYTVSKNSKLQDQEDVDLAGLTVTKMNYPGFYVLVFPSNESNINNVVVKYKSDTPTSTEQNIINNILNSISVKSSTSEADTLTPSPSPTIKPTVKPTSTPTQN